MNLVCRRAIGTYLCLLGTAVQAQNLLSNPSAERVTDSRTPQGWGMYLGAGVAQLAATTSEKHSGQNSACLELTGWHVPKDAKDTPANRSVSAAIALAENDGYSARGSLDGAPGTTYTFSFWYKGDVQSAGVSVTGWPTKDSDYTKRVAQPVVTRPLRPGAAWQQCTGTFRLTDGVSCFVLMINVGGRESEGFRLGKLYVDDVEITAKTFPDGQLRGLWCAMPKADNREQGLREIASTLDKVKACGLNSLMVWTESLYIAALDRPELRQANPRSAWDALGEMVKAAGERGMQIHVWYSPWIYKEASRAVELRDHPEWAAVNAKGVADNDGICLARPEVRQLELDLIARLVDRHPDLAGIHIEEPGYNWGQYCYCGYCKKLCRDWYGLDIAADPLSARPLLDHLAASNCTDFIVRLRQMLMSKRPRMWLSANGSSGSNADNDWRIGRDWVTWARRGYIDFYVPQIYTRSVDGFLQGGLRTKELLGSCGLVTGLAVSWSGIYPQRQAPEVIEGQILTAAKLGAKGFTVFHLDHFQEQHFAAIQKAVRGSTAR